MLFFSFFSFCREVFLCQVELFFDESSIGLDHIGKEGEDDKLETDDEKERGEKEIVSIRRDLKILYVEIEKYEEKENSDAD